jgi:hypothetical protein
VTLPGIRLTLVFTMLMITIWSFLVSTTFTSSRRVAHALLRGSGDDGVQPRLARLKSVMPPLSVSMSLICGSVVLIFVLLRRRLGQAERHIHPAFGCGGRTASTIPNYLILTLLAIFVIGPLLLLFSNSLRTTPRSPLRAFLAADGVALRQLLEGLDAGQLQRHGACNT